MSTSNPSPWVSGSPKRSSLARSLYLRIARQSFVVKVLIAAALGSLVSLALVVKSSNSSANTVFTGPKGQYAVRRSWKDLIRSENQEDEASEIILGDDLRFTSAEELPQLLNGNVGFPIDLSVSVLEQKLAMNRNNLEAKEFYENMLMRVQEKETWGQNKYSTNIACMIHVNGPSEKFSFYRAVATYGDLCSTVLVFIPSEVSSELEKELKGAALQNMRIIRLQNKRKKDNAWERTHLMWKAVAEDPELSQIDWFVKMDKVTFLSVNALRDYLTFYNPNVYHYLGHTLLYQVSANIVFNSGTCYVLSRAAVHRVNQYAISNLTTVEDANKRNMHYACLDRPGGGEDALLGVCLRSVGINPENTLDEEGRQRFLVYRYGGHRIYEKNKEQWFWKHKPEGNKDLEDCCVSATEVVAEGGFGDNARDDREFRRLHRRHIRSSQARQSTRTSSKVPPQPQFFLYDGKSLQLDEYGNFNKVPKGQRVFNDYSES